METSSYLHKTGSVRDALLGTLEYFGTTGAIAEAFGVQASTVDRWFRAGRAPGADIREEMQNYVPGQQRTVTVTGHMADSGRERSLEITLNRADNITYTQLLAEGKDKAAEVFLIAAQHGEWDGVPSLIGADWYPEDEDYYDDDYDYDTEYVLE